MAKRLSKEQLETDPLLTSYYIFVSFIKRNLAAVVTSSLAVLILIGGGIGYYLYSQAQEETAQILLADAEKAFQQGEYEIALWGDDVRMTAGFIDIINNYSRTRAGNLARYYAAVSEAEQNAYEEALVHMSRFDPPKGILGVGPISFHAVLLTNVGEFDAAARMYIKAAEWDRNEATTPRNLLSAARAYKEDGNITTATELVDRILEEYEATDIADQARRLQGMLIAHP